MNLTVNPLCWRAVGDPRRGERTLPLRMWLALAVLAVTGAGFLAQLGLTAVMSLWDQQAQDARLTSVREVIGSDLTRWRDPSWQHSAAASLDVLGADVALFPLQSGSPGQSIYATPGAQAFLATDAASVAAQPTNATTSVVAGRAGIEVVRPIFQRIVISARSHTAASERPIAVAYLWFTGPPRNELPQALWPAVELGTFALTLAIVVWLIGQPVLRPLAEMSGAAESIAGGDLNVQLPDSPVREIAEVGAALQGMSGALRDALARQSAIEDERRFFVSAIVHDLRTPLFMLRGSLMGLERGVAASAEKRARYLINCQARADELERLIADLSAYTRLEYLEQEPERVPLELGDLLRRTAEAAGPLAEAAAITLTLDGAGEPCAVVGDGHLLGRAIENLVDNALRYTPAGGRIQIRWYAQESNVVFTVEDSGPGIPGSDLPHIFTPLYRGDVSRNRQSGGAGLGLAIARRILWTHGGELTAGNRQEGGAKFTATLPLVRTASTTSEAMADGQERSPTGSGSAGAALGATSSSADSTSGAPFLRA